MLCSPLLGAVTGAVATWLPTGQRASLQIRSIMDGPYFCISFMSVRLTTIRIACFSAGLVLLVGSFHAEAGRQTGSVVEIDGLRSRAPAEWREVSHVRPPRYKHFILPRAEGDSRDAELLIFHFGGGGGSAKANIARWKTIFEPPRGKSIDDVSRVKVRTISGVKVTIFDVRGTYLYRARPVDPMLKAERRPEHRMIAGIIESANGPYFIRLVGPQRTVNRHKKSFDAWLKAFK